MVQIYDPRSEQHTNPGKAGFTQRFIVPNKADSPETRTLKLWLLPLWYAAGTCVIITICLICLVLAMAYDKLEVPQTCDSTAFYAYDTARLLTDHPFTRQITPSTVISIQPGGRATVTTSSVTTRYGWHHYLRNGICLVPVADAFNTTPLQCLKLATDELGRDYVAMSQDSYQTCTISRIEYNDPRRKGPSLIRRAAIRLEELFLIY